MQIYHRLLQPFINAAETERKPFPQLFENQWEAINQFITYYEEYKTNNVLCQAECLSGKTSTAAGLAWFYKQYYQKTNIFFILNQSSLANKNQTANDFLRDAHLKSLSLKHYNSYPQDLAEPQKCLILHSDDLNKIEIESLKESLSRNQTLILNDEVHYGLGSSGRVVRFFKKLLGDHSVTKWPPGSKEGYEIISSKDFPTLKIAQFSATAFSHHAVFDNKLPVVSLKNGNNYCSIRGLLNTGRLHNHGDIDILDSKKNTISNEFIKILKSEISTHGNGYYIIRIGNIDTYRKVQPIMDKEFPNVKFENIHNATSKDSIEFFQETTLAHLPKNPTIVWIYGAFAMGAQVNCEHIKMIWEPATPCVDTYLQRLGRSCGYGVGYLKKDLKYNIYCSLPAVKRNLDNYENGCAPREDPTTGTKPEPNYKGINKVIILDAVGGRQAKEEVKLKGYSSPNQRVTVSDTDENDANDWAKDVQNASRRGYSDKLFRIFHMNAPSKHINSWNDLDEKYKGKFVIVINDENYKIKEPTVSPKRSLLTSIEKPIN